MPQNFPALRVGISPETEGKGPKVLALRAGRPTTRFPHTYQICVYSHFFPPGGVPERIYRYTGATRTSGTPNMLPEGHCTRLNEPRGHTAAHARTEHNSSREQGC